MNHHSIPSNLYNATVSTEANVQLVLGSRSPRRARLLRDAGYAFVQADPPFADPPQPQGRDGQSAAALAIDLARCKALSLQPGLQPGQLILTADTLCVDARGRLLGQPSDRSDARHMLAGFRDAVHEVVTGIALLGPGDREPTTFADTATVHFGPIDDPTIEAYLDTGQWRGKAGGYNLFDRQHAGWPITVRGDATTVVGLPMRRLAAVLAQRGVRGDF